MSWSRAELYNLGIECGFLSLDSSFAPKRFLGFGGGSPLSSRSVRMAAGAKVSIRRVELRKRSFVDKPLLFDVIDLKGVLLNGKESSSPPRWRCSLRHGDFRDELWAGDFSSAEVQYCLPPGLQRAPIFAYLGATIVHGVI